MSGLTEAERKGLLVYLDRYDSEPDVNEPELYAVVERIVADRERAAEVRALRDAADKVNEAPSYYVPASWASVGQWLRDRADRIEADA